MILAALTDSVGNNVGWVTTEIYNGTLVDFNDPPGTRGIGACLVRIEVVMLKFQVKTEPMHRFE
jgi:hypothetical protein